MKTLRRLLTSLLCFVLVVANGWLLNLEVMSMPTDHASPAANTQKPPANTQKPPDAPDNTISVTINDQEVVFADQLPVIIDGRTLVPVRGVFEALGFKVSWDDDTRTAVLTKYDYEVCISVGSNTFNTNGIDYTLDVPAQIINGRTMVPLRLPLESVGYKLDWLSTTHTITISPVAPSAPEQTSPPTTSESPRPNTVPQPPNTVPPPPNTVSPPPITVPQPPNTVPLPTYEFANINAILNGSPLKTYDSSFIRINNVTLVSLIMLAENLDVNIELIVETKTLVITRGGASSKTTVRIAIDDTAPTINGEVMSIYQPAIVTQEGRTYIPLHFIIEAFGGVVVWDENTQTETITLVT